MMLVGSALKKFSVEASDGRIGTVSDFLFDDTTWKVRWMVVETGGWLSERKVLLHPSAIGEPDGHREAFSVRLTRQQVRDSPDILSDAPVSRQMQTNLHGYYGLDPLWGGGNFFGGYASGMGGAFDPPSGHFDSGLLEAKRPDASNDDFDPHLRSLAEVIGYHIQARDGPIGHVENVLVDSTTWGIRYLVLATSNWWRGQHVLMSPYAVREVSWADRDVTLGVTRDQVKGSPAWDPAGVIDRDFEKRVHGHYGWPGYGW